jgi:acyl-ACP thioesterase
VTRAAGVDGGLVERPAAGRVFLAQRRIRLSDMDPTGRLRLDAVARYLQDIATDDVEETGWGAPEHLWVIRSVHVEVLEPFLRDRRVELATWCSGQAAVAAGRRWSLRGDAGGRIEVDSVWIHLDARARPARLVDFGVYADAAGGHRVSTKLQLADPPDEAPRVAWALRRSDADVLGHINNASYWQAVEEVTGDRGVDLTTPYRALLDFRAPVDLGDAVQLAVHGDGAALSLAFCVGESVRAASRVERSALG